jgi:3',5'-cyclic-AMP phosphodiesterase
LTDIHVQPERRADEGFRAALKAVHEMKPRPDFILTGGDLVYDVLNVSEERANKLFDMYNAICRDSDIPFRQCIGNHEVFGWQSKGRIPKDHADYGKKMAADRLGLARTTYSFDHKGWHFCVVDDILPNDGEGCHGGISDEDMDWLDRDLAAAGEKPKVLCAHIPIVSAAVFRGIEEREKSHLEIGRVLVCRNPGPILRLLQKHRVNLVLTGHLHQNERIELDGTTHVGQGAVSGAWWKGPHHGNPEGFGVIDVNADAGFEHRYHEFGWQVG